MFEYQPGILVKSKHQGQMGIVLRVNGGLLEVFMGDGLTVEEDKRCWDIVPFNDASAIPASFSELVEGYAELVRIAKTPINLSRNRIRNEKPPRS